jgi:DNA invertase Pin-like site-specific DNA recombinase
MNTITKTKVKLFSYARFSSTLQKEGDSIHRQLTLAEEFVATHPQFNFELINEYEDDGRSAYHGKHLTVGRLGEFLTDVKAGRIESGAWLGIEDFDRLDRRNYLDAKVVFEELINAGVTIVVFRTGKVFDLPSLRSNPFDFMMALMSMVSANEYTERMSTRAKAVWKSKREAAVKTGKIMSANVPVWIDTLGEKGEQYFGLNEEKSAIIRKLINLFMNGLGCQSIATKLNLEGIPCIRRGKYWGPANVRAILKNESLCGRYSHNGIVIESYFPQILTRTEYNEVRLLLNSGNNSKPSSTKPANVLQGLCHCSECGALMTRVSQKPYRGRKAYENLVCIAGKQGKHKYRSIPVETVILQLFALLRFPAAFNDADNGRMAGLQAKRVEKEAMIERVTDAIGKVGLSQALQTALAGHEADLAALDREIEEEASRSVYGNAKRMAERTAEALRGMQRNTTTDAASLNATLRRLFKGIKIDIEAQEVWVTWLDGRVSVLTV